ncbi:MAG: hypothetical protein PWP16_971 [Eubacteriaceae bacterium]|jgi:hypothetical protein|nr:hypothetical protein [Eubacteriaceae bacterium]MDK2904335.1 hypothetical protein [Eubacteriaceae bacterium]MDK2935113.1 hypothetical protein [Eubacteriaceae bacterium]MDN5307608.1 hypothetical protein [Eubacteriaceae bacterium]
MTIFFDGFIFTPFYTNYSSAKNFIVPQSYADYLNLFLIISLLKGGLQVRHGNIMVEIIT